MTYKTGAIAIGFAIIVRAFVMFAQSGSLPRFQVASIKFSPEGGADVAGEGNIDALPSGRLTAEKASLRYIIQTAYRVRPFQVLGGPDWINSAHYNIEAKAESNASPQQMLLMLQALLEDRFKLKVRRETRQLPVYELTIAKGGLKLQPPREGGCFALPPNAPEMPPPIPPPGQPFCGRVIGHGDPNGPSELLGGNVTIAGLIRTITNLLSRPIIDKTGFTGTFDVEMKFTSEEGLAGGTRDPRDFGTLNPGTSDSLNPSFFTAMQEQLGLKLDSAKGPVEVVVIDHVERPLRTAVSLISAKPTQAQAAPLLKFEVAAIKPYPDELPQHAPAVQLGCRGTDGVSDTDSRLAHDIPMGRCVATFIPLQILVAFAYRIPVDAFNAISGAPEWTLFDRFDLDAKAEQPTTESQLRLMLQSLLAERFKLSVHWEPKQSDVLTLVVLSESKLKPSKVDGECVPKSPLVPCGIVSMDGAGSLHGERVSIAALMRPLSILTRNATHIVDATGLTGLYDISTTGLNLRDDPDSSLPDLATMLKDQLGLSLKREKRSINALVVDHVEKLSP